MVIDSKYTKIFKSQDLTTQKYSELYDFAVFIRNHKNKVSEYVNQNLLHYLEMSKFTFLKEMRDRFKGEISSSFYCQIYTDIFTTYQNKFDAIQKKLQFENITFQGFEFYKRNTKKHKKGDFKRVITEKKQTLLTNCLTYLARYGNENTVDYITKQLITCDSKKKDYYNNILRCINKFSFDRLMRLALSKRQQVIKHYSRKPIEFKSLTFRGRSRKTKILDYNTNYNSVIKTFISLSGFKGRKSLDIPVKFSKEYHGNIKEYFKSNPDYEYLIKFDEYHKTLSVYLCKDGERYIPEAGDNVVGIDVNCKHNLFSLSNESVYDYDRQLVNDFCKLSIEIDKLKENKDYKIGKRKQHKLDVLKMKMVKSEQQLISRMCKELKLQGINHIVMEDLNNGFGRCYVKDSDNEDINYNRKVKFLGLSSLKQEVEHIARKYNIAVSTVHSSYTSKMCPVCGCIEDENRPNQETFECIECGYESNADFNAANNIKNRVVLTVLRDKLLKQLDNGAYEPKKLKRKKVKEVLLSFRRNLQKVGSECIESSMTTFDYI
jgi:transposase